MEALVGVTIDNDAFVLFSVNEVIQLAEAEGDENEPMQEDLADQGEDGGTSPQSADGPRENTVEEDPDRMTDRDDISSTDNAGEETVSTFSRKMWGTLRYYLL